MRFPGPFPLPLVALLLAPVVLPAQEDGARAERVLAAVGEFEARFAQLDNLAGVGAPAGALMGVFARELPAPLAGHLSSGIADYVNQQGGLAAFQALVDHAPENYRASLPSVLSAERRQLLALSQAIAKGTATAPGNWATRAAAWAPAIRGKRGSVLLREQLDIRQLRIRGVVQGDYGALVDLSIACLHGIDTPQDGALVPFWGSLGFRVDQAKALSVRRHAWDSEASFRALAEAGSTWGMVQLAKSLLPPNPSSIPPGEARTLLEQAAARGFPGARLLLETRPAPALAAGADTISLPRLVLAAGGLTPEGHPIAELPAYTAAITRVADIEPAIELVNAGITQALTDRDPVALTDHLRAFTRQWEAVLVLWKQDRSLRLPDKRIVLTLHDAAHAAWKDGRFGTALLAWLALDRCSVQHTVLGEHEYHINATGRLAWATWRLQVAYNLSRFLPALAEGGLPNSHDLLPPWSPVIRHPYELFTTQARPVLEAGHFYPLESYRADYLPRLNADKTEVTYARIVPGPGTPPATFGAREFREVAVRQEQANPDYARLKQERDARLASLTARILALDERIRREVPMVTQIVGTRRVQTGTERVQTSRQGMPFDQKGVAQGATVSTGSYDRPVYQNVTDTITVRDENHPLVKELKAVKAEASSINGQPEPKATTGRTEVARTVFDRWSADAVVPVQLTVNGTTRAFNLVVPMIHELPRPPDGKVTANAMGRSGLRAKIANPAKLGAAEVHRAVATLLLREKLAARFGPEAATREAALVAELLFGFEQSDGGILRRLREIQP